MPDFKEIIEAFKEILHLIYGQQAPPWILRLTGYILLGGLLLVGLLGLLTILIKIKDLLKDQFWPIFYNKEKVRRSNRRRKFADHIESELRRLNNLEAWSDHRFAELEAEVDAEGRRRLFGIFPSLYRATNTLRRERSLSKALQLSDERLIIVEGDPGSGKSVALRHVATQLAQRAMRSRNMKSLIPIYVNLKEIERKKGEIIDRNLIEAFVLKVLKRANDRDIEEFLDEDFTEGLQNGTWFFLFDSFDEIPEVLSSTEADKIISKYATAVSDFLHGMNECRGVVASRFFHGPKQFGWPRFRILPLSQNGRIELVKRADLKSSVEVQLLGQLETTGHEIKSMSGNPMFLGLLCEHMRSGHSFPENAHGVFETYITSRLTRDEERLYKRFKLKPKELRSTAEAVAFCMAADPGLGLSPARQDITMSAQNLQITLDKRFDRILDAITYLKLARADTSTTSETSDQFTFAHRRFQEYFSTAVVLREPERVTPNQLLLDARWRETAVVLCQTQSPEALSTLLKAADVLIKSFADAIESLNSRESNEGEVKQNDYRRFQWPSHALHVMGLLQEGFGRRLNVLPTDLRSNVGNIVTMASKWGITADKKWALDVSGVVPPSVLTNILRRAFGDHSQVLKDSAYRQAARLIEIPPDIAYSIRSTLCLMTLSGRLRKERTATHAHLSRLHKPGIYLRALRLLIWLPLIDLGLFVALYFAALFSFVSHLSFPVSENDFLTSLTVLFIIVGIPLSYFMFYWNTAVYRNLFFMDAKTEESTDAAMQFADMFLLFSFRLLIIMGASLVLLSFLPALLQSKVRGVKETWFFIWLYIGSWGPSAVLLAREGRVLNPLFWPMFPILAIGKLIRSLAVTLIDLKLILVISSTLVGLFVTVFLIINYLGERFVYILFGSVFIIILGPKLISFLVSWLYPNLKDLFTWRRWKKSTQGIIDTQGLIEGIRSLKTDKYRVQLISTVRTKGLLRISLDTEETIYNFAKEIEQSQFVDLKNSSFIYEIFSIVFPFKLGQPNDGNSQEPVRNTKYGVVVLDEVLRLLEQIRATH